MSKKKTKEYPPEEGSTYYCYSHPKTDAFMQDLAAVFKKHKMIVIPTYEHQVSLHDSLRVVPLDKEYLQFVTGSGFDPNDFGITVLYDKSPERYEKHTY